MISQKYITVLYYRIILQDYIREAYVKTCGEVQKVTRRRVVPSTITAMATGYMYERSPLDLPHEGHVGIEETDRVASMSPQDSPGQKRHS